MKDSGLRGALRSLGVIGNSEYIGVDTEAETAITWAKKNRFKDLSAIGSNKIYLNSYTLELSEAIQLLYDYLNLEVSEEKKKLVKRG